MLSLVVGVCGTYLVITQGAKILYLGFVLVGIGGAVRLASRYAKTT